MKTPHELKLEISTIMAEIGGIEREYKKNHRNIELLNEEQKTLIILLGKKLDKIQTLAEIRDEAIMKAEIEND